MVIDRRVTAFYALVVGLFLVSQHAATAAAFRIPGCPHKIKVRLSPTCQPLAGRPSGGLWLLGPAVENFDYVNAANLPVQDAADHAGPVSMQGDTATEHGYVSPPAPLRNLLSYVKVQPRVLLLVGTA